MKQIKAVIFDMDGLMFDTEPVYYQANQNTADKLGMEYSFETYKQFIGSGDNEYRTKMKEIYSSYSSEFMEHFFIESTRELEHILLHGQVDKKPGLIKLLKYLKEKNIQTIVASSTNRELVDQVLARFNVRQYFDGVIGGDEVHAAKPNPEIFNQAFEMLNLKDKQQVIVLEDSKNGIRAAYEADIPVIMIPDLVSPDAETKEKTIKIYPDLEHIIDFIEKNIKKKI